MFIDHTFIIVAYVDGNIKICNNEVKFKCEISEVIRIDEIITLDSLKKKKIT